MQPQPMIALTNFQSILPAIKMSQVDAVELTSSLHAKITDKDMTPELIKKLAVRYAVKPAQISTRYFENTELGAQNASIHERVLFYGERAQKIIHEFYTEKVLAPSHIIHVTCTGYLSPSAPQRLVSDRNWQHTDITHAYHMGCYASLPAVRIAQGLIAASAPNVDIIHNEMCSLHLNPNDHSPEQLVVQSLFADGHIKYTAVPEGSATSGFRVINIKEQIVPNSHQDMSWAPTTLGMKMNLSKEVPKKIADSLRVFLMQLLDTSDENAFARILKEAHFAIHPGGPKIIEAIQQTLELRQEQVQTSLDVLKERGNMSSATLPHVWSKMLTQNIETKKPVISLAFGPGLTIFGALFESI